jgi:peptide/nickel transport system substrate-binding protein
VRRRRLAGILALAVVALLAVVAAGCGGGGDEGGGEETATTAADTGAAGGETTTGGEATTAETSEEGAVQAGGTFRVDWEASFNFNDGFDPTGEYLGEAWGIMSNLLVRTLVTYKHLPSPEGDELVPDLATDLGQVSDDGLTYTFTLKDGIKFGPPLSREITSNDIAFAFSRIGNPDLGAQYSFYYTPFIEGMQDYADKTADTISGIETPDDKTIVFHLSEPTGDFLYRLAMPATGPIPEEVAGCFQEPALYGRNLVSSGPYMYEGSDQLDATSCDTLQPASGFDPNSAMILVRNPDYDPATDSTEVRENFPDVFEFRINTNNDDIYEKVKAGDLEAEVATETPKVFREYTTNDELKDRLKSNNGDRTWYITMNLTQPPFDDIHVRKAVNLVMNKAGLVLAWGGANAGVPATHIAYDALLGDKLKGYDPYPSTDFAGDEAAAKEEMKQSKYDSDGDGVCDDPVCKDLLHVTGDAASRVGMIPVMEESLGKIGITLKSRSIADAYTAIQTVSKNIPISGQPGWGKDYADAYTFFDPLFASNVIIPIGNTNYSLVGLTPAIATEVKASGTIDGIPSVDSDLLACHPLTGDERLQCYADIDKKLMEEVVPWVPYLWSNATTVLGPTVTKYEFDQFSGAPAWAHVAVAQ